MEKQIKNCLVCGTPFEKRVNTSQKNWDENVKFCSRKCYWVDKNKEPSKICPTCLKPFKSKCWSSKAKYCSIECSAKAQSSPIPKCLVCGKEVKKYNRKLCSRECKDKWLVGKEVWNYVGGRAAIGKYGSADWLRLAERIRLRDGNVCQNCGKPPKAGKRLEVHHIEPYRVSQNDDESNLTSLCGSCHKIIEHKTFKELSLGTFRNAKQI